MYPWFTAALAEKAMILTASREWDQALDTAQRVLDIEADNLDALQIVAVHAFTQESQPHDAIQKLEDFDRCLLAKEPSSIIGPTFSAALFSNICCRQPRALQVCDREILHIYIRAFCLMFPDAFCRFASECWSEPRVSYDSVPILRMSQIS
jgi:hypothetical protein